MTPNDGSRSSHKTAIVCVAVVEGLNFVGGGIDVFLGLR
jgi:hypothetical protein